MSTVLRLGDGLAVILTRAQGCSVVLDLPGTAAVPHWPEFTGTQSVYSGVGRRLVICPREVSSSQISLTLFVCSRVLTSG